MYCKNCGQQLDPAAEFCKSCGSTQPSPVDSKQSKANSEDSHSNDSFSEEEISIEEQKNIIKKNKIFFSEDEVLIDTLGSGFLSSLFVQEKFRKSVLICSNKRVYQRGKLFEKNYQERVIYFQGEKSVDLREITGIKYYIESPIYRLLPVAIFLFIAIISFAIGQELDGNLGDTLQIIAGFLTGLAVILLIIYALKKPKWFEIEYAGGSILTNCNWYPKKNIRQFMINVSLQKDRIIEEENNLRKTKHNNNY